MKHTLTLLAALLLAPIAGLAAVQTSKPNILLILADDMGFSDLGCYGGEIATPNLDRLAAGGLRFTSFYNSAKCEPTRASLMSGQYWQDCGLGVKRGLTMGQAMKSAGYDTFAVGKWHLDGNPVERGFDHYFGHLGGGSDYFKGSRTHRLDDKPFVPANDGKFYTTDANADYAIKFISEAHEQHPEKPFFMYLAFNAPHASLQAKAQDIAKYRGKYRVGWDKLRAQRYQKQIELGITKKEWALSPRPDTIPAWDTLTPEEQEFEDVRMAVYAAQVDCMDQAIGRVLAQVKQLGEEENTLVIFLSDNGASPYDHGKVTARKIEPLLDGTSHLGYGVGWANVSETPFRHYKRNMFNGGSSTACIASWPAVVKQPGTITDQRGHIIDLMATIVDVGGGSWPAEIAGTKIEPLPGKSLAPILAGEQRAPHEVLYLQLFDHRAVIAGDMKLVSDWGRPAEMFNLATDRTELHDLSKDQPAELQRLEKLWSDFSAKTGVRLRTAGGEPIYRHLADVTEKFVGGGSDSGDEEMTKPKKKGKKANAEKPAVATQDKAIRARKDTSLTVAEGQLILTSTGTDPGLTFDTSDVQASGPYTLEFRMQSHTSGEGEVYWTHDAKTSLPKGQHQIFPVTHDGQWHDVSIKLDDAMIIHALRLDPCAGIGEVRIEGLRLNDANDKTLKQWPKPFIQPAP
ncbi:MAG: arylsulfatase [Verrucomicrobiaceae bacterium]|nr:arylsulfatase [Verrucomicrobiaceae bacterium]